MSQVIEPGTNSVNPSIRINHTQKLFLKAQFRQLLANHFATQTDGKGGHPPVVKLFGGGAGTWLLSEVDPQTGIAFGLCDPGQGCPELGYVALQELVDVRFPPLNTRIERDIRFKATKTMAEYADDARRTGMIQS